MKNEEMTLQDSRVYVRTYFRINTPSYDANGFAVCGFAGNELREAFYKEVTDVLTQLGFDIIQPKSSGSCPEATRGAERLYCHPQSFSGYVTEKSIVEISSAIEAAQTFQLRMVDKYDVAYNYTEEEFLQALEGLRERIIASIKERFTTKRRNLYLKGNVLSCVSSGLKIFRTGVVGAAPMERIESKFIGQIFDGLVAQGEIVTAQKQGATLYRTRSHRDPKRVA